MPIYDYRCTHCGRLFEQFVPYGDRDAVRCACSGTTARVWTGRAPTMVPDSIPGGVVIENLTPKPERYYSRSEIKAAQERAGVRPAVRHVGAPGSDKSLHTSRWV